MTFEEWAQRHPIAALELYYLLGAALEPPKELKPPRSEAWVQQQVRFRVAEQGAFSFRNNVGATPSECPHCKGKLDPMRYGLANDSTKLNSNIKSHDLILAIPTLITQDMVGKTFARFGSVECKKVGWHFTGTPEEVGQAAWGALMERIGAFTQFNSTGEIEL